MKSKETDEKAATKVGRVLMNRDRQEAEALVRKMEEILPPLKKYSNFGWIVPECMGDPVYEVYPDFSDMSKGVPFKHVTINVQNGWHSEFVYHDENGVHRIKEGVTPVKDEWSTYCYRSNCICKK